MRKDNRTPAQQVHDRIVARYRSAEHALAFFEDVPSNRQVRAAILSYAKKQRMMLAIAKADLEAITSEVDDLLGEMRTWQPDDAA